jgi:hypothetical protein
MPDQEHPDAFDQPGKRNADRVKTVRLRAYTFPAAGEGSGRPVGFELSSEGVETDAEGSGGLGFVFAHDLVDFEDVIFFHLLEGGDGFIVGLINNSRDFFWPLKLEREKSGGDGPFLGEIDR